MRATWRWRNWTVSDIGGVCFARHGNKLVPSDMHALDWLQSLPNRREVVLTVRLSRSPEHHRWFFAMLHKVVEATGDRWPREENLLDDLKFATGYYSVREDFDGVQYRRPDSISFASMSEDTFKHFVRRCCDVISLKTGIDPEALMDDVDKEQGADRAV
jgi:Protein of unknown function (DUF1367)